MFNHKAQLVVETNSVNAYGDPIATQSSLKSVFCRVVSADEKEKTLADSRGENAELVIILPDMSMYSGERKVIFNSVTYRVTDYKVGDTSKEIRLVVGRWDAL